MLLLPLLVLFKLLLLLPVPLLLLLTVTFTLIIITIAISVTGHDVLGLPRCALCGCLAATDMLPRQIFCLSPPKRTLYCGVSMVFS